MDGDSLNDLIALLCIHDGRIARYVRPAGGMDTAFRALALALLAMPGCTSIKLTAAKKEAIVKCSLERAYDTGEDTFDEVDEMLGLGGRTVCLYTLATQSGKVDDVLRRPRYRPLVDRHDPAARWAIPGFPI